METAMAQSGSNPRPVPRSNPLCLALAAVLVVATLVGDGMRSRGSADVGKWTTAENWTGGNPLRFPVHLALLPGTDTLYHSRIIFFNGEAANGFLGRVWGWRPITESCSSYPTANFDSLVVGSPGSNTFCAGATGLGDGRLFVIGGTNPTIGAYGDRQTHTFTPGTGTSAGTWGTPSAMTSW